MNKTKPLSVQGQIVTDHDSMMRFASTSPVLERTPYPERDDFEGWTAAEIKAAIKNQLRLARG